MNDFLKNLVPLIGSALGGPLGGAAASFVASKLGLDPTDLKAVNDVLTGGKMTPDQITQVKLAELDFQKFLESNKIDLARLTIENTKDARDMQKQTQSIFPATLSTIVTAGFFGILASMMLTEIRPSEPLLIMLGALGAAFAAVVNFWLGSSNGSQNKDKMLAAATPSK